jgi:16S rRNA (cytidine1402-2'-O)-methyltransferase
MLYLIPTILAPDSLDKVITPQLKEVIVNTHYFFVENVRTTRRFISELKLGIVIDNLHFFELTKDTSVETVKGYFKQIPDNEDIGVISEAGCPGIADPGAVAVKVAHQLGIQVMPLVGASSILLGLMASGFSGQSFVFHGYLPIEKAERIKAIKALEKEAILKKQTQIFMETPYRNNSLLEDVLTHTSPHTLLCIACNVTGEDELIKTKTIAQWSKTKADLHKKPTMFLISFG